MMTIKPTSLLPETPLFIYCIEGVVADETVSSWINLIGNWVEGGHSFLFFPEPADKLVSGLVGMCSDLRLIDRYSMTYGQWQGGHVEPFKTGRFVIVPPCTDVCSEKNNRWKIVLDPGVVFGNGTHPTTVDCLEAIEIACSGRKIVRMLDLGTGSGILALAGARLGCATVVAIDYTFLAARTAKQNVVLNGFDDQITVINAKAEDYICLSSELLVANIGYGVMKEIVTSAELLNHKWFVLSGLLKNEADRIVALLKQRPVSLLKRWGTGSVWQTIMGITHR